MLVKIQKQLFLHYDPVSRVWILSNGVEDTAL